MSSYHVPRVYIISLFTLYLIYKVGHEVSQQTLDYWVIGYRLIFLVAGVRAIISHVSLELNTFLDTARELHYSVLSTSTNSEVLAHYREGRLTHPDTGGTSCIRLTDRYGELTSLNPYNSESLLSVFWCTLVSILLVYNTFHLILAPLADLTPLLFGAPAYLMWHGLSRTVRIANGP